MIILTAAQASNVQGQDTPFSALVPRPLNDGTFGLPEAVLTDPAHVSHWAALNVLPTRTVADAEWA
jgi:hypothetical protein